MSRTWRVWGGIAAAAAWVLVGVFAAQTFGVLTTMPAAVAAAGACGVLAAGSYADRLLAVIAGVAGVGSLAVTAGVLLTGEAYAPGDRAATGWALAETAALLVLTLLVVRVAPGRLAVVAAGLTGIALPAWLLRFGWGPVTVAALGGYAAWALLALLAVVVGFYLRSLDERRRRSVTEARQAQRLQLARDLHDFVAHDLSGMLAQAQAGQILAEQDPAATAAAFRRIEQAGRQALASMDHTVRMLHDGDGDGDGDGGGAGVRATLPTLADLPDLAARFNSSGTTRVQLDVDPQVSGHPPAEALPRELTTTVYRVVVEALTNVRRHAPEASRVTVEVRCASAATARGVKVTITDDGSMPAPTPVDRRGGLGLAGLAERVEALGGTLSFGPGEPTGWRVTAVLPVISRGR